MTPNLKIARSQLILIIDLRSNFGWITQITVHGSLHSAVGFSDGSLGAISKLEIGLLNFVSQQFLTANIFLLFSQVGANIHISVVGISN